MAFQLGLLAWVTAASLYTYEALQGPTELLYWDKTNAYTGFTWFGVRGTTYLLDMEGRVVHTWPIGTNPHMLTNGNVLDANNNDPSGFAGTSKRPLLAKRSGNICALKPPHRSPKAVLFLTASISRGSAATTHGNTLSVPHP